jgi:hypothetical protein
MIEEWRDAEDCYPYQVSSEGRARISPDAPIRTFARPGFLLSLRQITEKGYIRIQVYQEGRRKQAKIHRLVARAFLGPCPPGAQVNHKNGIKTDNSVANLEYVTGLQNARHAKALGLHPVGREASRPKKLTEKAVRAIRRRVDEGEFQCDLAAEYGVKSTTINGVVKRRIWAWL